MVPKVKKFITCFWYGHAWSKTHRMYPEPLDGAVCMRCGSTFEDRLGAVI